LKTQNTFRFFHGIQSQSNDRLGYNGTDRQPNKIVRAFLQECAVIKYIMQIYFYTTCATNIIPRKTAKAEKAGSVGKDRNSTSEMNQPHEQQNLSTLRRLYSITRSLFLTALVDYSGWEVLISIVSCLVLRKKKSGICSGIKEQARNVRFSRKT
jgi:hypothetical protein